MKYLDHCKRSIAKYPTLFAKSTFEDSVFSVAHHVFIVLGNGYDWALDKDGNHLGYLTNQQYKKKKGEWVLLPDKPYGREKYESEDYLKFINSVFYSYGKYDEHPYAFSVEEIPELYRKTLQEAAFITDWSEAFSKGEYYLERYTTKEKKREDPYPNFSKRFSKAWGIEPDLIKPDWRAAMLEHHEHWLNYFKGPSPHLHRGSLTGKQMMKECWGEISVHEVQERWEVPMYDGTNADECVQYLKDKELKDTINFLEETVARLK